MASSVSRFPAHEVVTRRATRCPDVIRFWGHDGLFLSGASGRIRRELEGGDGGSGEWGADDGVSEGGDSRQGDNAWERREAKKKRPVER